MESYQYQFMEISLRSHKSFYNDYTLKSFSMSGSLIKNYSAPLCIHSEWL